MKEIKFRGQQVDTKEWVYGYYVRKYMNFDLSRKQSVIEYYDNNDTFHADIVIPETVGQFTGLSDMGDNEIYEGDWLKAWKNYCMADDTFKNFYDVWEITFNDGMFQIHDGVDNGSLEEMVFRDRFVTDFKVIGNVHNNPELLDINRR